MKSKVSVIIPVYNAEKYLRNALDSLVNQTLTNLEIICINDCSTDGSLQILNEYADKDNRFIIYTNPHNSGVGLSRNEGLKRATGEYIGFLDNDDTVAPEMYEKLYEEACLGNYDMVRCDVKVHENDKISAATFPTVFPKGSELLRERMLSLLLYQSQKDNLPGGLWIGGVWNKIFKKEFLDCYNICFLSEREFPNEDFLFNLNVLLKTTAISFINGAFYHHYNRTDSLGMGNYYYKQYKKLVVTREIAEKELMNTPWIEDNIVDRLYSGVCSYIPVAIINEWKRNPYGKKAAIKEIRAIFTHSFTCRAISRVEVDQLMPFPGKLYSLFAQTVLRFLKFIN